MEEILMRLQKLENETNTLKSELKKEREINRTLQFQISDMNEQLIIVTEKNQNIDFDKFTKENNQYQENITNMIKDINFCSDVFIGYYQKTHINNGTTVQLGGNNDIHKVYIPMNTEELIIVNSYKGYKGKLEHSSSYLLKQCSIYITVIFYGRIRKMNFLKKITYERPFYKRDDGMYTHDSSVHSMIRNSLSVIKDDFDTNSNEKFDFGKFNNGILEEFNLINAHDLDDLNTVEKLQSLKLLSIENAIHLKNVFQYIILLPNLNNLIFKNCPSIISEDINKLTDYCRKKDIVLSIS